MTRFALSLSLALTMVCAGSVSAMTLPNSCGTGTTPPPVAAPPLQEILNDLVVSGPPIDANAPSGIELFDPSSSPMTVQIAFALPDPGQGLAFGIYDADDPSSRIWLFSSPFSIGSTVTVSFLANGQVSFEGKTTNIPGGFDGPFGFFVKTWSDTQAPVYLYTDSELNGGEARAKVFQGNDRTRLELPGLRPGLFLESQFLIAWETGLGSKNDGDFNDLIVSASAITAVPEPGAAALVGLALLGALARMRKARLS